MIKYLTIYKRLRRKVHNLEIQNSVFQDVIENARQYAEELERQNQALKDALKKSNSRARG